MKASAGSEAAFQLERGGRSCTSLNSELFNRPDLTQQLFGLGNNTKGINTLVGELFPETAAAFDVGADIAILRSKTTL